MWYQFQNLSLLNQANVRQDRIHIIVRNLEKRTNALLSTIIDEDGNVISLEDEKSIKQLNNKKLIGLYTAIETTNEQNLELLDLDDQLKIKNFLENNDLDPDEIMGSDEYDELKLKGLVAIQRSKLNESSKDIFPTGLELSFILPRYKKTVIKLLKCFLEKENQDYEECILIP